MVTGVLAHKLLRDLWRLRGQALAIALVVASGVATFVIAHSTMRSLQLTQCEFYLDSRFADVFVSLTRAPRSLESRIGAIAGVDAVDAARSASPDASVSRPSQAHADAAVAAGHGADGDEWRPGDGRRGGRQRQGRQPGAVDRRVAVDRVHHRLQPGPAAARPLVRRENSLPVLPPLALSVGGAARPAPLP